jgi:hypothetical protein
VFNPTGVESLLARPDVDVKVVRVVAEDKTRLLRQLNREKWPDVKEIVRRFNADWMDFDGIDQDIPAFKIYNGEGSNLFHCAQHVIVELMPWLREGKNG